ncbi:MAG: hypothetical protein WCG21_11590 [Eubacteriales bacterium]
MLQSIRNNPMVYPPPVRVPPAAPAFDLMLSCDNSSYAPVVFINKALPGIFACIARELQNYQSELSLMRMVSGRIQPQRDGPLAGWYRSIFENIYLDVSPDKWITEGNARQVADFSLPVAASLSIPYSCYQYMTLTLPPLWKNDPNARPDTPRMQSRYQLPLLHASAGLFCHFRYAGDAGTWYASLDAPGRKKRIIRRLTSPDDPD